MNKSSLIGILSFMGLSVSAWGGDLQPSVHVHIWGVGGDLAWRPLQWIPGTQTTFRLGGDLAEGTWNYWHDPSSGAALGAYDLSAAAVAELTGSWFTGISQGLVAKATPSGPDNHPWVTPDLIEAFGYYRGRIIHPLSSGSNWANSTLPDKNGYVETALLGGFDWNLLTEPDEHNLKTGFLLEVGGETAPPGWQSVGVDCNKLGVIWTGFLPLYDANPSRLLNTFSVLAGLHVAFDRLWGTNIPAQERQTIWDSSGDGVPDSTEGIGGAIRGVESGQFDGNNKFVANFDLRFNLPALAFPDFVHSLLPDLKGSLIPGVLIYSDFGSWSDLPGIDTGFVSTAGVGGYLNIGRSFSLAIDWNVLRYGWLSSGGNNLGPSLPLTADIHMHF